MTLDQGLYAILAIAILAGIVLGVIAWQVWLTRWRWRQKGVGFAEGWFMVVDGREGRTLRRELYPGQRRQTAPEEPRAPAPTAAPATAPDGTALPTPKYTITGKQVR